MARNLGLTIFSLVCLSGYSHDVFIPHLTAENSNWGSFVQADSMSTEEQTFTITLYRDNSEVFSQEYTILGLGRQVINLSDEASQGVCGVINFDSDKLLFRLSYESFMGGGLAEFALADTTSKELVFLFSDFSESIEWKGIAVANLSDQAITADLYAIGEMGILNATILTVDPKTRIRGVHSSYFPNLAFDDVKSFVLVAEEPLLGIAISGDATSGKLLFTQAIGISGFDPGNINPDSWLTKTSMPSPRGALSLSVVNDTIYAIGGEGNGIEMEAYDLHSGSWSRKTDSPVYRVAHHSSVVCGKIYVFGGTMGLGAPDVSDVHEYDPATDTWTIKSPMPAPRRHSMTCVIDEKIFVMGGMQGSTTLSTVEVYDPATDTWERKASMPTSRHSFGAGVVNGKIYIMGGAKGSSTVYSSVKEYDPVTNSWSTKSSMPTPRVSLHCSVLNGKIYAIGGSLDPWPYEQVMSTVEEYDPLTDSWTTRTDKPTARNFLATCTVQGKIYAIGGNSTGHPWTPTNTVEEYTPPFSD